MPRHPQHDDTSDESSKRHPIASAGLMALLFLGLGTAKAINGRLKAQHREQHTIERKAERDKQMQDMNDRVNQIMTPGDDSLLWRDDRRSSQ